MRSVFLMAVVVCWAGWAGLACALERNPVLQKSLPAAVVSGNVAAPEPFQDALPGNPQDTLPSTAASAEIPKAGPQQPRAVAQPQSSVLPVEAGQAAPMTVPIYLQPQNGVAPQASQTIINNVNLTLLDYLGQPPDRLVFTFETRQEAADHYLAALQDTNTTAINSGLGFLRPSDQLAGLPQPLISALAWAGVSMV